MYVFFLIRIHIFKKSEVDIYLKGKNKKVKVPQSWHQRKYIQKNQTLYWIMGHLYSDLNWYHKRKIQKLINNTPTEKKKKKKTSKKEGEKITKQHFSKAEEQSFKNNFFPTKPPCTVRPIQFMTLKCNPFPGLLTHPLFGLQKRWLWRQIIRSVFTLNNVMCQQNSGVA